VVIAGARPAVRRALLLHGVRPPQVRFRANVADAMAALRGEDAAAGKGDAPQAPDR
jgi:SulP family sulfate permease